MMKKLKDNLASVAALIAAIVAIGGGFVKYGELTTKLQAIEERKGCLLSNHGQICIGKNLEDATHLSTALEKLSKQYFFCLLSNQYKLLSDIEMDEVLESFSDYKSKR